MSKKNDVEAMRERALAVLCEIMEDDSLNGAARVAAAREVLDRVEGKPRQRIEQTIKDESTNKFNSIVNQLKLELTASGDGVA